MFEKVFRWYNQNKILFITIILIIIVTIAIIKVLNNWAKSSLDKTNNTVINNLNQTEELLQSKSGLSNTQISTQTAQNNNDTIKDFVSYCNNGKIEDAYNMLSSECKKIIYPSEDNFKKLYYDTIFTKIKTYTKDNLFYSNNRTTYLVTYTNDALANGGVSTEDTYTDYITVIYENNQPKLNISNFIGEDSVNKIYEDDSIKVTVISRQIYMDYETYVVEFNNKTNNQINLYDTNNKSKWYITNSKDHTYDVVTNEIQDYLFILNSSTKEQITMKFMQIYNTNNSDKTFSFDNIITNIESKTIKNVSIEL